MTHLLRIRLAWWSLAVAGCALAGCQTRQAASAADIGAGTGLFTMLLSQEAGPKGKVYAVDIAKDSG